MQRNKLREVRKKRGYSQQKMSELLEIARTTYTGYEIGKFAPSLDKSLRIKEILRYKKDDLFEIK
ncbi:MAG: helix-turn-helix domain-containing protein [Clostridia bacterium]|nr:helix-turn-helix domain-containing protein [Clostridia bacterium]